MAIHNPGGRLRAGTALVGVLLAFIFADAAMVADPPRTTFLLLPYFENSPHYDAGREIITRLLIEESGKRGMALTRIEESRFAHAWAAAVEEAGGLFRPGSAYISDEHASNVLTGLYRRIGADHGFDGLLVPALVPSTAMVIDGKARWDGVARRVKVRGKRGSLKGIVAGVSLRLTRLDPVAEIKLARGVGGLVLPFYVDSIKMKSVRNEDAFDAEGELREGVEIALDSLLANR